jgi:undecaprenyl-diphosphatase
MEALDALILGIIQGIAEWLPISSSGHLVIAQELMGMPAGENLFFDLVVHLGTVLAVCVYFRRQLWSILRALFSRHPEPGSEGHRMRTLGLMILLGTVPVMLVGVTLASVVEDIFSLGMVGIALLVNGTVLLVAERACSAGSRSGVRTTDALVVGAMQAISIIPGVSRSGLTLSGGMFRGLEKEAAATFAFLLSVPALLGAFVYGAASLERYDAELTTLLIGSVSAFLVGLVSIDYLLKAVRASKLWVFSIYCFAVGTIVLLLSL